MTKITAAISAVGKYVPEYVLTNKELETYIETNDEWITSRTGIKERRILKGEGLGTSYMAIKAFRRLNKKSEYRPKRNRFGYCWYGNTRFTSGMHSCIRSVRNRSNKCFWL
jgi:hypothetical protein